jgi:hypothetical protein
MKNAGAIDKIDFYYRMVEEKYMPSDFVKTKLSELILLEIGKQ